MKKLLGILVLSLLWCNSILADINLSCVMTDWNERDSSTGEFKFTKLTPSHFTAIIEITSPGEVIGRLIGTSETGFNMDSPLVGTISDSRISMNHKKRKLDEIGTNFNLNLISGMFEINHHTEYFNLDKKEDKIWYLQEAGRCEVVKN